jgi:tetratricopeptide (TPR) repeat protein
VHRRRDQPEGAQPRRGGGQAIEVGEAVEALTTAASISPEDERAWFGLAEALQQSGDTSRADDAYQRVIALNEFGEMADMARQARSKIATGTFREAPGDVRMDAVMYLLSALEKFQHMETAQLQKIGFEIAMLGTQGININDPDSRYTIETLSGEFTGLSLVCHQYAAFKRFAPEMDIGIDLSKEYEAARGMFRPRR